MTSSGSGGPPQDPLLPPALSRKMSSTSSTCSTAPPQGVDEEILRYAKWISSQAGVAGGLDQKLAALSKRTAAELRRVDREHAEHARRLEVLEELCAKGLEQVVRETAASEAANAMQHLRAQLDERLQADFRRASEDASQMSVEMQRRHKQFSDALEGLARHIDGSNEGFEKWRLEADTKLKAATQELEKLQELPSWRRDVDSKLAVAMKAEGSSDVLSAERQECRAGWEAAVRRERKAATERLTTSCTELTSHLNELREELLDQRALVARTSEQVRASRQEAQRGQKLRDTWLEAQVAELGSALAVQLDEKLQGPRRRDGEGSSWYHEVLARLDEVKDLALREAAKSREMSKDEARIVHHEVMSLDMRVSTLEAA
jgi:hypothetical protein